MTVRPACRASVRSSVSPATRVGVSGGSGYDIVLLIGQSNMIGRNGPIDAILDAQVARILQYKKSDETVAVAADPLDHWDETANTVGLGLTFAKQYLATISSQRTVLLIPAADGGTSFSGGHWIDGGDQNDYAIAAANAALSLDGNNRVIAFLWHQGESDSAYSESQYSAALDSLISRFRSEITGAINVPFVVGGIKTTSTFYSADVNDALTDTPNRVAYTAFVDTEDLTLGGDSLHFTAASCRTMGERYFSALATAKANTPSAPGTISDLAASAGDTQVVLTWSAPSANKSAITDYLVQYKESASGTWLTFSDGTSATTGATVTGLTNDTAYDFRVAAVNGAGTGSYSSTVSETPESIDADAAAFISAVETADGTSLSSTFQSAVADLVAGLKTNSMWTGAFDYAGLFACGSTIAGALTALRGSDPTNNGYNDSAVDPSIGITTVGTKNLLSANAANVQAQNDCHYCVYISVPFNLNANTYSSFGNSTSGTAGTVQLNFNSSIGLSTRMKSGTATVTAVGSGVLSGLLGVKRISSTEYIVRVNGSESTISVASNGNLATAMTIFARAGNNNNFPGTIGWYSEGVGDIDFDALETLLDAYFAAVA